MTDLVIVECLLPDSPVRRTQYDEKTKGIPAAGLMISVSNNGIHHSKEKLKFISYDSVCMECNVSTGCVLKASLTILPCLFSDVLEWDRTNFGIKVFRQLAITFYRFIAIISFTNLSLQWIKKKKFYNRTGLSALVENRDQHRTD